MASPIEVLAAITAIELWLALLFPLNWDHGLARGAVVLGLLLALALIRFGPRVAIRPVAPRTEAALAKFLKFAVVAALLLDIGIAGVAIARCLLNRNEIPMDQGPTLWRSARLLWQGENPYGPGALADFYAYEIRAGARRAEGIVSSIPEREAKEALARYDRTLDPELRGQLLPAGAAGDGVLGEARLLGYKYGPLLIDTAALFVPLGLPCATVVLNIAMYAITLAAMARLFWGAFEDKRQAMAGILALLLDRHMSWNYIELTIADIWALAFCALGVLAFQRGKPLAMGAFFGAAIGCKIFPSLIFLPLLLACGGIRPIVAAAGIAGAIYLPWLAWDPVGVLANVFLWPLVMSKDSTSWTYYAPPQIVLAVRLAALGAFAILWHRYLTGRETRLFWTLAVANTLLLGTGGTFHGNYVPWASIWVVAAVLERYSPERGDWLIGPGRFEASRPSPCPSPWERDGVARSESHSGVLLPWGEGQDEGRFAQFIPLLILKPRPALRRLRWARCPRRTSSRARSRTSLR